ncbi:MAG: kynureninase [Firmicutes bacterium]|nr:kynureninase [Bacillota bacterium]
MDKEDKLKDVRNRFYLKENEIYMDGNSLGLMSKDSEESLLRVMDEWKNFGINGWMKAENPWFYYRETLAKMQAPLVGAEENEIIIHSSTTLNLHCLVSTFFKPNGKKNKILVDDLNFPSDRYAIESQLKLKNLTKEENLIVIESKDGRRIDEIDVVKNMTDEVALILLPSVLYRSGQLLDIKYLTKEAHKRDIIIGFDCCHSAGAVEHHLSEWGVDFAFWCNYKYFNNGPGGVASLYVNKRHFNKGPGLSGWFGYKKDKQFDLSNEFSPSLDAGAWQVGSPHIFSMAPLEGSLKIFNEVGIKRVREKSLKLTNYMMYLIDNKLSEYGFFIGNPRKDNKRGGHVSLEHDEAVRINEAMKDRGIVPDFRYPNVIRLAPIALYTSFNEVWKVIDIIKEIMETKEYEKYSKKRGVVA